MTVAGGPLHEKVISAQSVADTTHTAIFAAGYAMLRVVIVGGAGVTGGTVQLEGAATRDYAGTWAAIGGAATALADAVVGGGVANTFYPYVRARIATAITGGTVDVWIVGN